MCCKLMAVHELEKGVGRWCSHIKRGAGCGIYEERPQSCRAFSCEWLLNPGVPEDWRPDKTKFLIAVEQQGTRIRINVDENTPSAWRLEPYYSFIKQLSRRAVNGDRVIVCIGQRRIYVFPDKDIDLGPVDDGAPIHSGFHETPGGLVSYARVLTAEEVAALSEPSPPPSRKRLNVSPASSP